MECLSLNRYILLPNQEKTNKLFDLLNLSTILKKILEKDKRNQDNKNPILMITNKNKEEKESLIKNKFIKYDDRIYTPEVLFKIEHEENQVTEDLWAILNNLTKNKKGEILNKAEYFFRMLKHMSKIFVEKPKENLTISIKNFLLDKYFYYIQKGDKIYEREITEGFVYYLKAFNLLKLLDLEYFFLEQIKHCKKGNLFILNVFIKNFRCFRILKVKFCLFN